MLSWKQLAGTEGTREPIDAAGGAIGSVAGGEAVLDALGRRFHLKKRFEEGGTLAPQLLRQRPGRLWERCSWRPCERGADALPRRLSWQLGFERGLQFFSRPQCHRECVVKRHIACPAKRGGNRSTDVPRDPRCGRGDIRTRFIGPGGRPIASSPTRGSHTKYIWPAAQGQLARWSRPSVAAPAVRRFLLFRFLDSNLTNLPHVRTVDGSCSGLACSHGIEGGHTTRHTRLGRRNEVWWSSCSRSLGVRGVRTFGHSPYSRTNAPRDRRGLGFVQIS